MTNLSPIGAGKGDKFVIQTPVPRSLRMVVERAWGRFAVQSACSPPDVRPLRPDRISYEIRTAVRPSRARTRMRVRARPGKERGMTEGLSDGHRPPPPARFTRPRVGAKWHRLENPEATNRFHQSTFCGTASFPARRQDWVGPGGPPMKRRCRTCQLLHEQKARRRGHR